ncbi:MAG: transglycosylase SLT domain-containing protein [Candidatus Woesearchaeota archaeon]
MVRIILALLCITALLSSMALGAECDTLDCCIIGKFNVIGEGISIAKIEDAETSQEKDYIKISGEETVTVIWEEEGEPIEKDIMKLKGFLDEGGRFEGEALGTIMLEGIKIYEGANIAYILPNEKVLIKEGDFEYNKVKFNAASYTGVDGNKVKGEYWMDFAGEKVMVDGEAELIKGNIISLSESSKLRVKDYEIIATEDGTRAYFKKEKDANYDGPAVFMYKRPIKDNGKTVLYSEYRIVGKTGFNKIDGGDYAFVYEGKDSATQAVHFNFKDTDHMDVSNSNLKAVESGGVLASLAFNAPIGAETDGEMLFVKTGDRIETVSESDLELPAKNTIITVTEKNKPKQVFKYDSKIKEIQDDAGELLMRQKPVSEILNQGFGAEKAKRFMQKHGCLVVGSEKIMLYKEELLRDRSPDFSYKRIINSIDTDKYTKSAIAGIIGTESHFNKDAKSSTGCAGLMQLCSGAARGTGACDQRGCSYGDYRYQPDVAIPAGYALLLKKMIAIKTFSTRKDDNFLMLSLAAYNAGEGIIGKAIKKAGANANFEKVMSHLTPEMIKDNIRSINTLEKAKKRKDTIPCYVGKVMYLRALFVEEFEGTQASDDASPQETFQD